MAVKHFLERTPAQKAINNTSSDFPSIPVVKDSLKRWCQSDEFLDLIESLNKGQTDAKYSEDEIIKSFVKIGLFHDRIINTFESARQVLQNFAEHLEQETYKSDDGLYIESRRAKHRHSENQARFENLSAQLNSHAEEIKEIIQEKSAKNSLPVIQTEIIKSLNRINVDNWEQESKTIRRLIEMPSIGISPNYAEFSISENRILLPKNSQSVEASYRSNLVPEPATDFIGRKEIIVEIENSMPEARLIVIGGISGVGKTELLKQIASHFESNRVFWYEFQPGMISFDDLLNRLARFLEAQSPNKSEFTDFISAIHSQISLQDKIDSIIEMLNKFSSKLFFDRIDLTNDFPHIQSFFSQLKEQLRHSTVFAAGSTAPEFLSVFDKVSGKTKFIALGGFTAEEIQEFWKRKNITINIETAEKLELNLDGLPTALELLALLAPENASEETLLKYAEDAKEQAVEFLFDKVYARLEQNEKELLTTAALLRLPFSSEQLLSVQREITGGNARLSFQKLERQSIIKKQENNFFTVTEIISELALTYAEGDLDKRRTMMAEYLFEEMPDDITPQLETVLLYKNAGEFDKAAETVLSIMSREFIVYDPHTAKMLVEMFDEKNIGDENRMWMLGEKGRIAEFWHQPETAEKYYREMLESARKSGDKKAESIALMRLGISFLDRDEKLAEQFYTESLALVTNLGDEEGQADVYSNLGVLYNQQEEFEKAETAFIKCLEIHQSIGSEEWRKYGVLTNLGILYARQNQWDKAFEQSRRALQIAESTESPYHIARAIYNLGIHEQNRGNKDEALKHFENVLKTATKYDLAELEDMVRVALGLLHFESKNFPEAISNFQKVIEIREELENFARVVPLYFDVGTFYIEDKNLEKALEFYLKGIERFDLLDEEQIDVHSKNISVLARKLENSDDLILLVNSSRQLKKKLGGFGCSYALARIYGVLGDIYLEVLERRERIGFICLAGEAKCLSEFGYFSEQALTLQDLAFHYQNHSRMSDAIRVNNEAEQIAKRYNLLDKIAAIHFNTGNCYAELEMPVEAEKYYRNALEAAEENNDLDTERLVQHNLGEILRRLEKYEEAAEMINSSLEYCRKNNDFSGVVGALNNLGLVRKEQNDKIRSAELFNEAIELAHKHSLHAQEANALISLGNLFQDEPETARIHFDQALNAARLSKDIDMEEGAMLSLGFAHRELGTFDDISTEFQKVAERANELNHNENLIKMLTLGGEVNLEEGEAEAAAEMFEKALLFAYHEGLKSILQFHKDSYGPFHFSQLTHVLRRIIAAMIQAFEENSADLPNSFYQELKRKINEANYWSEKVLIMQFLQPIENYFVEVPSQTFEKYVFSAFAKLE